MGANDIQQSLLDAIQLLSSKAANSTNAAIIIKGEIVEELDSSTHQYSISYGGAIYNDAYAISNVSYPISTIVHVLIPDGNFDNKKIIMTSVTPAATDFVAESESDLYIPISDNLFGGNQNIDLKSWIDDTEILDIDFSYFNLLFQDYLTTNRNFVFSADIKTEIDINHQNTGNYGLILNLPFIQSNSEGTTSQVWKSYIMDVSTMQGNPYAYNEYQKINLYYTVDDTLKYDTTRTPYITAFTQDFGYTEPRTDIDYDIHIRNISMNIIDVLTEAEFTGYYLSLVANDGNYFLNGIYTQNKILKPILKINSKESKITSWDCYWFVEDTSIDITSEGYSPIGGLGWKCINKKTNVTYDNDGNKTFQYITNNYTYTVTPEDVTYALRYKCVLVKDEVVVSGSIKLKNLNSDIITSLISATGSNTFIENIGTVKLLARIYYPGITDNDTSDTDIYMSWQRFDRYGKYLDNDFYYVIKYNEKINIDGKQYYETEIDFPCSKIEKLNSINCTFYSRTVNNGIVVQNNLGTERIIITTSADFTYGLNVVGGDVLYKYDADGDSPLVANYDGPISSRVKTIDPITYSIFKPDGSELDDIEYLYVNYRWSFPKNSMMKLQGYNTSQLDALEQDDDYYYITGWGKSNLNYTILDVYNKKKDNNSILLNIEIDGNQISSSTNPKFLKDGEGGTNGSKYAALLTYQDYAYGERDNNGVLRKLQAVYVAGTGWRLYDNETKELVDFGSPTLVPLVYRDGERITSGYNISWSMFDMTQTNPCFGVANGIISVVSQWTDPTEVFCSVVECMITITEDSRTNSQEVIYAYYPIEITRILNLDMVDNIIPSLDGGFEEVVYASDGTNPQYDNTNNFECINNTYNDDVGDYYDYAWSCSNNLKIGAGAGTGPSASIKPVTKFDNGLTKNFVKVILTMSESKRTEIQNKITELTANIATIQDKINFYQHNRNHLLDFVENFEYNYYEEKLNNSKTLLNYRYELLNYIPKLREILEELNTYCIDNNIKIADFNYTRYYSLYNTTLNTAYKNLYLLGYNRELSDISDLTNTQIIVDVGKLTTNYSASIAQQINNMVIMWTTLINKYQEIYTKLVQQSAQQYVLQNEYDNLNSLYTDLEDFIDSYDLTYLTTAHDNNDPEQEFVRLKTSLSAWFNQIEDYDNGELISYSTLVNQVFKPISEALAIYKNTEYQEKYYDEKDAALKETLTELQNQKASYEAMLLPAQSDYITHIKPIVMLFNRYELGNINGWDGSKLYIDQTNNEYLLAPQVGAGAKKNGLFTGVIMGVKQFNASRLQHIGLFGYSEGIQSFFLNSEDGSLILGKSGPGQIISDPSQDKALLYSSNYWKEYNDDGKPRSYGNTNLKKEGMLIDLTTPEIRFGNGNFVVTNEGHVTAAGGGQIAGWKINDTEIYSNINKLDGRITIDSGATVDHIDEDGNKVYTYTSGKIYSHNHSSLDSKNTGFYLSQDGLSFGNTIKITSGEGGTVEVGRLSSGRHWTISGNGSNSYIGYNSSRLNTGTVYIGTDGISLSSDKFYVTDSGYLLSRSGQIGGWNISNSELSSGGISIKSSGSIEASGWYITGGGSAKFDNITCNNIWSFGSGSNTWSSGSGYSFGWGGLNSGSYITLGGSGYGANGIQVSSGGGSTTVSGTLYAQNGHIGGNFVVDGDVVASGIHADRITVGQLQASQINCTGVINAASAIVKELAAEKITSDYVYGKIGGYNAVHAGNFNADNAITAKRVTASDDVSVGTYSLVTAARQAGNAAPHGNYTITYRIPTAVWIDGDMHPLSEYTDRTTTVSI